MSKILARKNPSVFKTLPLHVEAGSGVLSYRPLGTPLNFSQMLERRHPIELQDTERFSLELANLGVSVDLTLNWQGQDFKVLVRQQRQDRGDVVLKLISGYVAAHELSLPLLPAIQEIAEECLLETPEGWLTGRFDCLWLATPYADRLHYRDAAHFKLSLTPHDERPVLQGQTPLRDQPRAYLHLPTASLQLVYSMRLEIPREAKQLSLYHVDEHLEADKLIASLARNRPNLYLLPLEQGLPSGELMTLRKGQLTPASTRGLWLSEGFAPQEGWIIRDERIRWKDWLATQPQAVEQAHKMAG